MDDNDDAIYDHFIEEDNVIEESIEEYGDYNYIEHIKDEDMSMEEEHLEDFEEDEKPALTITRTVTLNPSVSRSQPNMLRGTANQIMIVQNTVGNNPIKLIQPQQTRHQPVVRKITSGGSMVHHRVISPPQQQSRMVTQMVPQNAQPKFIVKHSGQQVILATPQSIKQEPESTTTITRQLINRPGLTISRTSDNPPTILNAIPRKSFPAPSMTVKQIRSPPAKPPILNRHAIQVASPQKTQYVQRLTPKPPAGKSSGSIQAVNIPGKGLQYVKVLNSQAPSNMVPSKPITNPGRLMSAPGPSAQKMLLPGKATGTYTLVSSNAPTIKKEPMTKPPVIQRRFVQQPISQPQKMIAVVKKEKDGKPHDKSMVRTTVLTTSQLSQLKGVSIIPGSNNKTKIVMLPSNYMEQLKALQNKQSEKKIISKANINLAVRRIKQEMMDDTGKKRRCNCTKSQCLKLYCDCFAAGEFCANCNCKECLNDQENEHERQKAIRSCLERNPHAFK